MLTSIKYNEHYLIDKEGNIYSNYINKYLKPYTNKHGYKAIKIKIGDEVKHKYIHRLVAETFIIKHVDKTEVNHIDGNKLNNNVENLEWCTRSENLKHMFKVCGRKPNMPMKGKFGKENPCSIKVWQKDLEGNKIKLWTGIREAARQLNLNQSNIIKNCKKINHTCGGFIWRYYDEM